MKKRPHIIIFNPDEMRTDTMGHMGNPAAVTPHLDTFAREDAVSFSRAYCQNPVCVPSRCSFFTGLYPHVLGHRTMAYLLRPSESSLFQELKDAGYYVWMNNRNDLYAGQYEGWLDSNADELFHGGNIASPPGPEQEGVRGHLGDKNFYSHYHGKLKLDDAGRNYTRDDEVVDALIARLENPTDERPICAFVGLMYPHTPYAVEEPYYSAIDRAKLPPRIKPEDCHGKPYMQTLLREKYDMDAYTEADWDELRATYLGMCMKVDEQFGRLCDALKRIGIYDDSAIFVLSDHGDFAGDYGLPEKAQNCFEECLSSVPFLVKPPRDFPLDAGVCDSLVELVDFYATVMELAQVEPTHTHFGKSLLPLLADRSCEIRETVFCEGGRMPGETHCDESHSNGPNGSPREFVYWPRQTAQRDDFAHEKATMIRDKRYKYILRSQGLDEFYDLEFDPREKHNQIEEPQYQEHIVRLKMEMLYWYQKTCDIVPFDFDARFSPDILWSMVKSRVSEDQKEEVKRLIDNGAKFPQIAKYL